MRERDKREWEGKDMRKNGEKIGRTGDSKEGREG